MNRVSLLGSTGSVGRSTLDVARAHPDAVKVVALSARRRVKELAEQVLEFRPALVALGEEDLVPELKRLIGRAGADVVGGAEGLQQAASLGEADTVLNALVGSAGILPSLAAVRSGKDLAVANKECLVAAGEIIVREAATSGAALIPVDSEHSAVYQCLKGEPAGAVAKITLTASGGPLKDVEASDFPAVTADFALRHPTWSMGEKVTIDSATLMNKGFEVIEAHWLFGLPTDRIDVLIDRKSVVHCLVEFLDGTVLALLSPPDMRLPIQYALTRPGRMRAPCAPLDLAGIGEILFEKPDYARFPCLELAYRAAGLGGTAPAALSAADEVAVESFLAGRIKFGDIYSILKEVVGGHEVMPADTIDAVMQATEWARARALTLAGSPEEGG